MSSVFRLNVSQIQEEMQNEDLNQHNNLALQSKKKIKIWLMMICLGILIIIGIFLICYITIIRNRQKPVYVVIIDAGSTGSRVHAFNFHKSASNGSLMLDSEFYARIKPGLSSFADDPVKGAEFLNILVDKAKASIPKSEWGLTPLILKATAGLRLLPKEKANRLLEECEKLFKKSGFFIDKQSVSIMDGAVEGIFSWFTVNFLLGRLDTQISGENTVATLELGGGSTQVTFVPNYKHIKNQENDIHTISIFGKNISIYSYSYLGMGLKAARKEILTYGLQGVDRKDYRNGSEESITEVHSECINPIISTNWSYGGVNYLVGGLTNGTRKVLDTQNLTETNGDRPVVRFSKCLQIVKNYVGTIVNKPVRIENQKIVAISGFSHLAKKFKTDVERFNGGIITVDEYLKQAMLYCDDLNIKQPFMCLDLTYMYALLRDGFNLQPTTKLELHDWINDHKVSWALGAAMNILQNML